MKKRLFALLTALLLTFSVMAVSAEDFPVGDIDFSGEIDASDLTALARHVGGIEALAGTDALLYTDGETFSPADLDLDGAVGASDLTVLARHVGGIEAISVVGSVALAGENEPLTHLRTSIGDLNCLDLTLSDETLTVSGRLVCDGLTGVMFCGVGERKDAASSAGVSYVFSETVKAQSGQLFTVSLPLDTAKNTVAFSVYTHIEGDEYYWSVVRDIPIVRTEDGFVFVLPPVLENNLAYLAQELDPAEYLGDGVSDKVQALSDEIVGSETDDYRKMFLINKWLADNLYYDYDYLYGRGALYLETDDVITYRRTVCSGYARLQRALLRAQGIPAITTVTYSPGGAFLTGEEAFITEGNHEHCEAYLASEDRWVTMDSTWDSNNIYQNGQYEEKDPAGYLYFDASPAWFAYTHKIVERPCPEWYYA